jgi:hypothetical protein
MMSKNISNSLKSFEKGQGKNNQNKNQKKTIFQYLENHIATGSMISEATGIPQKSICRYKRDLELQGLLYEVEKKSCKITGFKAWYLTTNQDLFPHSNQFSLFN